ncbi:hypothetical protein WN943_027114 [Citrus x changshan-huyou]
MLQHYQEIACNSEIAGYAVGGGHVLHMVCDLTIAANNAIFGQTSVKHVKGAENLHYVLLKSVPFDLKDLVNYKDHGLWIGKSKLDETCSEEPNVTLVKVDGAKPMTLVSWKIKTSGIDQGIDMLPVLSSPTNQLEKFTALNDVEGVTNQLDAGCWLLED